MKRNIHSRWLVLSAMVVGLLCQAGPCAVAINTPEDAQDIAQQVALFLQQSATNAAADTVFFFLDNLLVHLAT